MSDTDQKEDDTPQPLLVGMLLRCFLCHEPLPQPRPDALDTEDDYFEWPGSLVSGMFQFCHPELHLISTKIHLVFPYIAEDGSVQQQLRSTHVQSMECYDREELEPSSTYRTPFWEKNPLLRKLRVQEYVQQTLCGDYCSDVQPDGMVYLSHRDCWKVAFSSHRWSRLAWSRLAVQTRPFEIRCWRKKNQIAVCHEDPVTPTLGSVPPDSSLVRGSTPLASLLASIYTLPLELQFQIMGLLKGTMFASLLQTKTFVSEMLPLLRSGSSWTIRPRIEPICVDGDEGRSILSCHTISIMGRPYLRGLTLGQPTGSGLHIPIAKKAVRGVQFALGRFGLRGIRILYGDGSSSPWLGDSSCCWIGAVRCYELSKLKVVADVSCHYSPCNQCRAVRLAQSYRSNLISSKFEVAFADLVAP
jgi:hypothetical protein